MFYSQFIDILTTVNESEEMTYNEKQNNLLETAIFEEYKSENPEP